LQSWQTFFICLNRTQADVTKKLGERIHDINFWKFELQREIDDLIAETDLLFSQKVVFIYLRQLVFKFALSSVHT